MQRKHIFIPILEIIHKNLKARKNQKTKIIKFKTTPGFLKEARGS
jgi:hypothetical protein